jgi:hypothetical protein
LYDPPGEPAFYSTDPHSIARGNARLVSSQTCIRLIYCTTNHTAH